MTTDLDAIERLAREATPGPWKAQEHGAHRGTIAIEEDGRFIETIAEVYCGAAHGHGAQNARYIAALSPEVVLDLVRRARLGDAVAPFVGESIAPYADVTDDRLGCLNMYESDVSGDAVCALHHMRDLARAIKAAMKEGGSDA